MANKFSKSNNSSRSRDAKTMEDYRNRQRKLNFGAKVMAIILIVAMVVFYVLSASMQIFG